MKHRFPKTLLIINYSLLIILSSCSVNKQISKQANTILLKDSSIASGHIGISIYEPATGKYWYDYNSTHYFIPASNTKLFTLYAGMKYLGDSLVGLRYTEKNDKLFIKPTGDPTFLLPEYKIQNVYSFLKDSKKKLYVDIDDAWEDEILGDGWAWNDYMETYMAGRSVLPIYGNIMTITGNTDTFTFSPPYFKNKIFVEDPEAGSNAFKFRRNISDNNLALLKGNFKKQTFTFYPDIETVLNLLKDTLKKEIDYSSAGEYKNTIHSQPTDSLFKPMMHRSDNFFAEQTLLMASNEHLGYMSDEKIIDTLLKTDLKDVPQRPKWVDGSGLSRYNLFTPKDFVYILNKMQNEFGLQRMKVILPTGGEGTITSYFKKDAGFIYAKTGTLSNNCALSGYLITSKGKLLIFSILANNYISSAAPIRRAEERFLEYIREKY